MIRKALLFRIYDAANMQRWNDKIRPVELRELDKQAHKMVIAYMLGKFEEQNPAFNWIEVIEGGMIQFLQRTVLTDLKPQVFYKIKEDKDRYARLNQWVYEQLKPVISSLGAGFEERYRSYFDESRRRTSTAGFWMPPTFTPRSGSSTSSRGPTPAAMR